MSINLDFKSRRLLAYCLDQTNAIPFSWAHLTVLLNRYKQRRIPLHALFSVHHAINTAHLSYSNFNGPTFLEESNTKVFACVAAQS